MLAAKGAILLALSHLSAFGHPVVVELVQAIQQRVRAALAEDLGHGDVTTLAIVPEDARARAVMQAREPLVVCGLAFAEAAFRELSNQVEVQRLASEGLPVQPGVPLLQISGQARALLSAERVALNFVQRLSGVATLTAQFVDAVKGMGARILDTSTPWPARAAASSIRARPLQDGDNSKNTLSPAAAGIIIAWASMIWSSLRIIIWRF